MAQATTAYRAKGAAALSNPTSATVFKASSNSAQAAYVDIPVDSGATNAGFRLRARGRATTGTTSNFKATLQFTSDVTATGSSTTAATAANNTDFYALTNRSLATITRPWAIDCKVFWDSTSQRLVGQDQGSVNAETIETAGAIITALTGIDLSTRKCGFVVSAIFGTSNASNSATLDELALEVI